MIQANITEKLSAQKALYEKYGEDARIEFVNVRQLRSAQAWVITDQFGNKWLQSYSTIVSVWWADTRTCQRFGRWSTTTSKHQTWFEKEV